MMLALIHNDQILAEIFPGSGFTLPNGDRVSPAHAGWDHDDGYRLTEILEAEPVPEGKQVTATGPVLDGDGVVRYVHELEDIPAPDLAAYAAERRWDKEVGGIVIGGMQIASDDRSKILISGARQSADNDSGFTTRFKSADGLFVTIDAATIILISNALRDHVAACFALEDTVLTAIADGQITTVAEIDAAFA